MVATTTVSIQLHQVVEDCAAFGGIIAEDVLAEFNALHPAGNDESSSSQRAVHMLEFVFWQSAKSCLAHALSASSFMPAWSKKKEQEFSLLFFRCMLLWDMLQSQDKAAGSSGQADKAAGSSGQADKAAGSSGQAEKAAQKEDQKDKPASSGAEAAPLSAVAPPKHLPLSSALVSHAALVRLLPFFPTLGSVVTAEATADVLLKGSAVQGLSFTLWDKFVASMFALEHNYLAHTAAMSSSLSLRKTEPIIAEGDATLYLVHRKSQQRQQKQQQQQQQQEEEEEKAGGGEAAEQSSGEIKESVGHGRIFLTMEALYFIGDATLLSLQKPPVLRFDLSSDFDNSLSVVSDDPLLAMSLFSLTRSLLLSASHPTHPSWVLEFVEYRSQCPRDTWQAMIGEVLAAHTFLLEYSPEDLDFLVEEDEGEVVEGGPGLDQSQGLLMQMSRATTRQAARHNTLTLSAATKRVFGLSTVSIRQLQVLQQMSGIIPPHPERLLPFLWAKGVAEGHLVEQAVAVLLWGEKQEGSIGGKVVAGLGGLVRALGGNKEDGDRSKGGLDAKGGREGGVELGVVIEGDVDGMLKESGAEAKVGDLRYEKKWMRSKSWRKSSSVSFWKETRQRGGEEDGGVLMDGVLIGVQTQLLHAVEIARKAEVLDDKARESVESSLLHDIPTNVTLLMHLIHPLVVVFTKAQEIVEWKQPVVTIVVALCLLFLVNSVFLFLLPSLLLLFLALLIIILRHSSISTGPLVVTKKADSTSTLTKIKIAKQALDHVLTVLQQLNIVLLKIRTLLMSDVPQATNHVLVALPILAIALFIFCFFVPFRVIATFVILEVFSRKLDFRRPTPSRQLDTTSQKFLQRVARWWRLIPVPPVAVQEPDAPAISPTLSSSGSDNGSLRSSTPREGADSSFFAWNSVFVGGDIGGAS